MIPVSMKLSNSEIIEANCTVNEDYFVMMGDERFYRMIGDNTMYSLDWLVHPKDREQFLQLMSEAQTQDEPVFIRFRIRGEMYRWMLVHKMGTAVKADGHRLTELHIQDVLVLSHKFDLYYNNVRKYRSVLNLIREKIFEYDFETGLITIYCYMNNCSEIMEKDELEAWQDRMLRLGYVEENQAEIFRRLCEDIKAGTESFSTTFQSSILSKGGRRDMLNFRGETITDGSRRVLTIGLISEIGGRMEQKNILYEAVNRDSSTGLLNKKAVTEEIIAAINAANLQEQAKPMYLVVYDIDDFKNVNDRFGHYFGDIVIQQFTRELSCAIEQRGITGRIGGDEFISLLTDFEDIEEVRVMLKAIRKRLKVKLAEEKPEFDFSVSMGISEYSKDGTDYETLFKIADGALYIAKEKGKDRYIIYDRQRHGDLLSSDIKMMGINAGLDFMKQIDKCDLAVSLMLRVIREGAGSVAPVLEELMERMNVHGISVFTGADMKCIFACGTYATRPEVVGNLFDGAYRTLFDTYGINCINNVASLVVDYPEAYTYYKQHDICSSLQFRTELPEQAQLVVNFDIFGANRRKWSQDDISTIYMVVKAIADVERHENEIDI